MKVHNQMEYGEVEESVSLTVEYDVYERERSLITEGKMKKEVSFDWKSFSCGNGMSIGAILDFQEKATGLLQLVKSLLAEGTYVKVSVSKAAYEHVPEYEEATPFGPHKTTLRQLQYDSWGFEGNCLEGDPDEEGAGLYMCPDTQYTDATWDMILFWNQDILKSLAEAHL